MPINYTYAAPGVQVIAGAPPTPAPPNINGATVLILGRAPKGPRNLVFVTAAEAPAVFGDEGGNILSGSYGSTGFDIPTAIRVANDQINPSGNVPLNFLVGRVGVAPATYVVKDRTVGTPIPCFTLYGEGPYAGTAGANLAVAISLDGSFNITTFDIMDISAGTSFPVLLQRYNSIANDLSSNAAIVATINAANPVHLAGSIVSATIASGSPTTPAAITSPAVFATGSPNDGKAAAWSDATVAPLLADSLNFAVDWIYTGFDAAVACSAIQANQDLAVDKNDYRRWVCGPKRGTTFTSLSTTYVNAILASERVSLVAHDACLVNNPTTGQTTPMDGWILAAAVLGIKAKGPTNDAGINAPLIGIVGIVPASDNNGQALTAAQLALLALPTGSTSNSGQVVCAFDTKDNAIEVLDMLTTAPYLVNGGENIFRQLFATHINDSFNDAMAAGGAPFVGRSATSVSQLQQNLVGGASVQVARLAGTIENVQLTAQTDPSTGQPTLSGTYEMVTPALNITIPTSFTIASS